jgi:hypothetical protein
LPSPTPRRQTSSLHPAGQHEPLTYFDRYGTTFDRGPHHGLRFDDGPGTIVEIDIEARPSKVWELVTDINLPARFSKEFQSADWLTDTLAVGAVFNGRNHRRAIGDWTVPCYVDTSDVGRTFGWRTSDPEAPGARWSFELERRRAAPDCATPSPSGQAGPA